MIIGGIFLITIGLFLDIIMSFGGGLMTLMGGFCVELVYIIRVYIKKELVKS